MSGRTEPGKTSTVQDVNALKHELAYVARVARCSSLIDELLQDSLKRSQLFSTARDLGGSLFGAAPSMGRTNREKPAASGEGKHRRRRCRGRGVDDHRRTHCRSRTRGERKQASRYPPARIDSSKLQPELTCCLT